MPVLIQEDVHPEPGNSCTHSLLHPTSPQQQIATFAIATVLTGRARIRAVIGLSGELSCTGPATSKGRISKRILQQPTRRSQRSHLSLLGLENDWSELVLRISRYLLVGNLAGPKDTRTFRLWHLYLRWCSSRSSRPRLLTSTSVVDIFNFPTPSQEFAKSAARYYIANQA